MAYLAARDMLPLRAGVLRGKICQSPNVIDSPLAKDIVMFTIRPFWR
jgi:hypothetical protein